MTTSSDLDPAETAALQRPRSLWLQLNIEFADPARNERIAAEHLLPVLQHAQTRGELTWWFLRKPPGWRVRVLPDPQASTRPLEAVEAALATAHAAGAVLRWWTSIYEEETAAFGGEPGMTLAHELFAADSTGIARLITTNPFGDRAPDRRLLSMLLMTHLHHAAGLDTNERGDVWAKVANQRPTPDLTPATLQALTAKARTVLTTQTSALTTGDGLLSPITDWTEGIARIGERIGAQARQGTLTRGLRAVLALHVIFHWNRMGVPGTQQAAWATASRNALLPGC